MSEEISLLIEKMISKIDALVPYIEDSEEILLASKTLQELINVKKELSDIEVIKVSITQLDKKITDLAIELRAKDSQLVLDLNTADTKISNNEVNILRNEGAIDSLESNFNNHIGLYNNPHKTTKAHVGLNNVFNYGATTNPEDSSENKYALAKGVNTVWGKVKEYSTLIERHATLISNLTSKVTALENELPNLYRKTGGTINGNVRIVGSINSSGNVAAYDRSVTKKEN